MLEIGDWWDDGDFVEQFIDIHTLHRMYLVPIDFSLDLVYLVAHLIYPPLHDLVGLGGRVVHLMQPTKILSNR